MKSHCLIAPALVAVLASWATTAQAATEEKFNRAFTVAPGGTLTVDVDFGAIEVTGTAGNQVTVDAVRKVRGKSEAAEKSFLAERPITANQEGDRVTVTARKPKTKGLNWGNGMRETSGRFVIAIPTKFDVRLDTAGGHIHVTDLTGIVRADTSGGGLKFSGITGPVHGSTSGGGIDVTSCSGELKVDTSGGGIDVTGGGGNLKANTSGGSISVKDFSGPAKVETSGGGLNLSNVGGELKGGTSGGSIHATLPQPIPGAVRLETSGGGVTLAVVREAAFELDASTSGGRCSSDIALANQTSDKKDRDQLRGAFGDGGPKVVLRSSGGSIRVRAASNTR